MQITLKAFIAILLVINACMFVVDRNRRNGEQEAFDYLSRHYSEAILNYASGDPVNIYPCGRKKQVQEILIELKSKGLNNELLKKILLVANPKYEKRFFPSKNNFCDNIQSLKYLAACFSLKNCWYWEPVLLGVDCLEESGRIRLEFTMLEQTSPGCVINVKGNHLLYNSEDRSYPLTAPLPKDGFVWIEKLNGDQLQLKLPGNRKIYPPR